MIETEMDAEGDLTKTDPLSSCDTAMEVEGLAGEDEGDGDGENGQNHQKEKKGRKKRESEEGEDVDGETSMPPPLTPLSDPLLLPISSSPFLSAELEGENPEPDFIPATMKDFDDAVPEEERKYCLKEYSDLNNVKQVRMHCTACNKHLGLSAHNVSRLRMHPLLRTLVCIDCLDFYNSGEFSKGEDGSELYCRWCGQGGQVYCCSSCPVVFCEKCIKRNFSPSKIEDIESIDDWSCFVCSPEALWVHRGALWAARRYCALKNKCALTITDPGRRLKYQRECQIDESSCCKRKIKITNNQKAKVTPDAKKIVKKSENKKNAMNEGTKRRSPMISKKSKMEPQLILGNLAPNTYVAMPPAKKIALSQYPFHSPAKIPVIATAIPHINKKQQNRKQGYKRYNGYMPAGFAVGVRDCYSNVIPNDNLNLSLESLTQGLDMSSMSAMEMQIDEDNVVCTPDFPLPIEPLCEVRENDEDCSEVPPKVDDDVQCLTPNTPRIVPKPLSALMSKPNTPIHKPIDSFNVIQMTEKDVSINKITGGLKFRVDPATLSTSKMYQLPDGRIFAVNMNSKMPGGYSATIVSVNDPSIPLLSRPGLTVKPTAPRTNQSSEKKTRRKREKPNNMSSSSALDKTFQSSISSTPRESTVKTRSNSLRESTDNGNMSILEKSLKGDQKSNSVEWYTYNMCDAIDLVDYVSKKLHKMKNTPTGNLRNKTIQEMKEFHYTFDQILKISCQRFHEVRNNLNNEFKLWLKDKCSIELFSDEGEDEDNVEITSDNRFTEKPTNDNSKSCDEPIFIDENSNDSMKISSLNASKSRIDSEVKIDSIVCNITAGSDTEMDFTVDTDKIDSDKDDELKSGDVRTPEKTHSVEVTSKCDENLDNMTLNDDSMNKTDSCDGIIEKNNCVTLDDSNKSDSTVDFATEKDPSPVDTDELILQNDVDNHESKCDNGELDDLLNEEDTAEDNAEVTTEDTIMDNNALDKNCSTIEDNNKSSEDSNLELDGNDISNNSCDRSDKILSQIDDKDDEISSTNNGISLDSSY
ncbi:ADD domain-containing protein 1 isoform X2 [Arctopsyche grandis]|uniref:ADD domain-containing protein 1 isoform X2 n=1 Tax=Arctopsyche grandis TaxID=121162 RepID=UPI00406D6695